jgi:chromate transporter
LTESPTEVAGWPSEAVQADRPVRVAFREAFLYWLRLGFINFGGPAGQIAMMHRDLVERRQWISEKHFLHALNFCMLLPGPEAQQLAIYIGWLLHGTFGGVVAGAFFVLPSVFVLLGLSYVYAAWGAVPAVAGILSGLQAVVLALVAAALLRIGRRALRTPVAVLVALAAFAGLSFFHVPFPLIVLGAGLVGLLAGLGRSASATDPATPAPVGAAPSTRRTLRIVAVFLVLWLLPFLALVASRGLSSLHTAVYVFFSKAAFVTFGGAYAVLAYVVQAAVRDFGWITHAQAVAGLGLAETTPGPLIMVLQFVGFMAGWNRPEGMTPSASAMLGAVCATWATFLPCFFFVFLGAPYIERLRGNRRLASALEGITAAVVGVIANLALVFGTAVLAPAGLAGGINLFALFLGAAAFLALRFWPGKELWVIAAGAAIGLVRGLV